jgi:CRP-like cAMP-binding protein
MSMSNLSGSVKNEHHRVLLTAKNHLEYLTGNDWALIADRSQVLTFNKEEVLIQVGMQPHQLFFILSGRARIESTPGVKVAEITVADVCGEMSFLEGSVASARVVADSALDTLAIEWTALHRLFDLYPHLGSRFFRSLALNLSRRLRKQLSRA